jgi:hypothetical protein
MGCSCSAHTSSQTLRVPAMLKLAAHNHTRGRGRHVRTTSGPTIIFFSPRLHLAVVPIWPDHLFSPPSTIPFLLISSDPRAATAVVSKRRRWQAGGGGLGVQEARRAPPWWLDGHPRSTAPGLGRGADGLEVGRSDLACRRVEDLGRDELACRRASVSRGELACEASAWSAGRFFPFFSKKIIRIFLLKLFG